MPDHLEDKLAESNNCIFIMDFVQLYKDHPENKVFYIVMSKNHKEKKTIEDVYLLDDYKLDAI